MPTWKYPHKKHIKHFIPEAVEKKGLFSHITITPYKRNPWHKTIKSFPGSTSYCAFTPQLTESLAVCTQLLCVHTASDT